MDSVEELLQEKPLSIVVKRNQNPILVINPYGDFYQFLHLDRDLARSFHFPEEIEQRIEVVASIKDIEELDKYAFVISGVLGFEVERQDIGLKNTSTDEIFKLTERLTKSNIPLVTLTECCGYAVLRQFADMPNLIRYGMRPTEYLLFSYICNCYSSGKILPAPSIIGDSNDNLIGIHDKDTDKQNQLQYSLNLAEISRYLGWDK